MWSRCCTTILRRTLPRFGERPRGQGNSSALNAAYPATVRRSFVARHLVADGDGGVSAVIVTCGLVSVGALSFFTVRAGRLWELPDSGPIPLRPRGIGRTRWGETDASGVRFLAVFA